MGKLLCDSQSKINNAKDRRGHKDKITDSQMERMEATKSKAKKPDTIRHQQAESV